MLWDKKIESILYGLPFLELSKNDKIAGNKRNADNLFPIQYDFIPTNRVLKKCSL